MRDVFFIIKESENKSSFQANGPMKISMAQVANAGQDRGKIILVKIFNLEKPSTIACSPISLGIVRKNPTITQIGWLRSNRKM
jgi:hypothetical protein